jgi:hypothetical protein
MYYLEPKEAIERSEIIFNQCCPVKLYYVIYGRIAWHSKRIRRYTNGCMQSSFSSAKIKTEKERKQGSVFYIKELPAIQFLNDNLSVIITEINTESPLINYKHRMGDVSFDLKNIYDYFMPQNPNSTIRLIWHKKQELKISNTIHKFEINLNTLEKLQVNTELKAYKSVSHGSKFYLGWNNYVNKIKADNIISMANVFNTSIQG